MEHLSEGKISKKQFEEIDSSYKEILYSCHGALTGGYPDDQETLEAVDEFNSKHEDGY